MDLNNFHPREVKRNSDAEPLIRARLAFINKTGSLMGVPVMRLQSCTNLPEGIQLENASAKYSAGIPYWGWREFMRDGVEVANGTGNFYFVLSYENAIAWTRSAAHDGQLVMPEGPVSATTAQHRAIVSRAGATLFVPRKGVKHGG